MGEAYFLDVKSILAKLAEDSEMMLEERIVVLRLVEDYTAKLIKELEDEVAKGNCAQDG